ncbi:MAG: glycerate kinase, partial [Fulvivirga sp.]|nr:glycerate kinase [Fulvivirga sp.]
AIQRGAKVLYLFVGGSATCDVGIGMASALGYRFYDSRGYELKPVGEALAIIAGYRYVPMVDLKATEIKVMVDVDNPFTGINGAAQVYAPQKGASDQEVTQLDQGLANMRELIKEKEGIDLQDLAGAGAAGGLGGGAVAFLKASIQSGVESILTLLSFDDYLKHADLVITGEGSLDDQTLHGKVVDGVLKWCMAANKPVWIICGKNEISPSQSKAMGIDRVITLIDDQTSADYAMKHAGEVIEKRMAHALSTLD